MVTFRVCPFGACDRYTGPRRPDSTNGSDERLRSLCVRVRPKPADPGAEQEDPEPFTGLETGLDVCDGSRSVCPVYDVWHFRQSELVLDHELEHVLRLADIHEHQDSTIALTSLMKYTKEGAEAGAPR